jgi:hypothetical protein
MSVLVNSTAAYGFECDAGPLEPCAEWIELLRRLNLPPTFSPNAGA